MTIAHFLNTHDLEKTLLIGYYGGGNFGDELLLEVMQNLLNKKGVKDVDIGYMPYVKFADYHHNFGYKPFRANAPTQLLQAIMRNKNVIVGGGGIWGLDAKLQPLLMSIALAMARVLGKKVYLLGVGYYQSTNWYGHFGAWLAARAAHQIVARDAETWQNFEKLDARVSLDTDLAWNTRNIDASVYQDELAKLEYDLPIQPGTLLITLRRFSAQHLNDFDHQVGRIIAQNPQRPIVVALLEPRDVYMAGHRTIEKWQRRYPNVRAFEAALNPVAFYLFLAKHHSDISVISPQFHAMLCAHLAGARFLPLVYDNKCEALLQQLDITPRHSIYDLKPSVLTEFVKETA